ncbi:hypothetical protein [Steroidobacter cummioxidans]|uniref:hypothetical protein n=1 Tax=Steroidobacter cummioxidans TaxID=1803913 RepID=UPI0012907AD3|nr:hypothetical protein [Steroidobacter cummioxidans]
MRLPGSIAVLSLLVGACSGPPTTGDGDAGPVAERDYTFTAVDVPSERRFKLVLESKSRRQICTGASEWPNAAGFMENASMRASVIAGQEKFRYQDFSMDVCPWKSCGNPMKQGARLESSLFYKHFALPERLYEAPKELVFRARPFWCDTGRWLDDPKR